MYWQIFVIFHKNLFDEHYTIDPSFDHKFYTFIKTNPKVREKYNKAFGYKIIKESDFQFYSPNLQTNNYMAPSAIYHIYKNNLHKPYKFVGFLEYDIVLSSEKSSVPNTITDFINNKTENTKHLIMPFVFQHPISRLATQTQITLNGKNALEQIILDYNSYFKTKHIPERVMKRDDLLTSQQSFLTDVKTFEKIMGFISWVIENKLAERPNSWHRPSTLMDRYFAFALYFENISTPLYLKHKSLKQWRNKNDWRSLFK